MTNDKEAKQTLKIKPFPGFEHLSGRTVTVAPSGKVSACMRGEPPHPDLLQEGLDRAAWQRVLTRLQGKAGLLWKILPILRAGREKINKAQASSEWPPSKKRAELTRILTGINSRIDSLRAIMKSVNKEEMALYLNTTTSLRAATRSIGEILKTDIPDSPPRKTVKARHDFIHKANGLLNKEIEGFTLKNKEDFKLLVDICLTVGAIDIPADFPEDLKKTLIKHNVKVK